MRILATCDWFSPSTGGGAERVAWEVYRRLAADGHHITVVGTAPGGASFASAEELPPGLRVVRVRSFDLSGVFRAQVGHAFGLDLVLVAAAEHTAPDVIHANSLQFQTTRAAARLAVGRGIPLVVTGHIGSLDAVPGATGVLARCHERMVGRSILRRASRAIAVSEPVRAHLAALAPGLPIDVVPNGVDVDRYAPSAEPRPDWPSPLRIGIIGRLVPNKGPATAIRAIARLARRGVAGELIIVGDGPLMHRLRALTLSEHVAERVRFLGHRDDVAQILRGLDILVRPSLTEGMPLGVLEAMAAGVPVVASDIPGNAAVIAPGETGLLVRPGDHRELADAIERLARHPWERKRLARSARQAVATNTWDSCAAGTLASLERAIEDRATDSTIATAAVAFEETVALAGAVGDAAARVGLGERELVR